jgi:hypothetical protein
MSELILRHTDGGVYWDNCFEDFSCRRFAVQKMITAPVSERQRQETDSLRARFITPIFYCATQLSQAAKLTLDDPNLKFQFQPNKVSLSEWLRRLPRIVMKASLHWRHKFESCRRRNFLQSNLEVVFWQNLQVPLKSEIEFTDNEIFAL